MSEFEDQVKEYMKSHYAKNAQSWRMYESAKSSCLNALNPSAEEYPIMIKIITDYLGL